MYTRFCESRNKTLKFQGQGFTKLLHLFLIITEFQNPNCLRYLSLQLLHPAQFRVFFFLFSNFLILKIRRKFPKNQLNSQIYSRKTKKFAILLSGKKKIAFITSLGLVVFFVDTSHPPKSPLDESLFLLGFGLVLKVSLTIQQPFIARLLIQSPLDESIFLITLWAPSKTSLIYLVSFYHKTSFHPKSFRCFFSSLGFCF